MTSTVTADPRLKAIVGDAPIIAVPYHTETAVLVNGLVKRFRNGAAVIDGLQLTVGAGSRVAIIG
ncbi:MAG: hypothetical protein ACRCTI_15680, partial [Beijerinckiaceae bacterium]